MPCVNHFGFVSGCLMALLKQLVIVLWMKSKAFNWRSETLSICGDFHFYRFLRVFFRSSTIISSHTCFSNPLDLFYSLLSHSAFQLQFFSISQIFFPDIFYFILSEMFLHIHFLLSQLHVKRLFVYFKDAVLSVECSSLLEPSETLHLQLNFMLQCFFSVVVGHQYSSSNICSLFCSVFSI